MAIDKALYEMPEGLEALALEEAPIEIEIEDPESVTIGMGGVEIEIEPGGEDGEEFDSNLAEFMKEGDLQKVASDVMELSEQGYYCRIVFSSRAFIIMKIVYVFFFYSLEFIGGGV